MADTAVAPDVLLAPSVASKKRPAEEEAKRENGEASTCFLSSLPLTLFAFAACCRHAVAHRRGVLFRGANRGGRSHSGRARRRLWRSLRRLAALRLRRRRCGRRERRLRSFWRPRFDCLPVWCASWPSRACLSLYLTSCATRRQRRGGRRRRVRRRRVRGRRREAAWRRRRRGRGGGRAARRLPAAAGARVQAAVHAAGGAAGACDASRVLFRLASRSELSLFPAPFSSPPR